MTISIGDRIPDVNLLRIGENGPEAVNLSQKLRGRKIVLFAVPGAFTPTCHNAHLPSFIRNKAKFDASGIDEIIGICVNDPFVVDQWDKSTGAGAAGITLLADAESKLTTGLGMNFDAPPAGLLARSLRYAAIIEDGKVVAAHIEENPGICSVSSGEALLDALMLEPQA